MILWTRVLTIVDFIRVMYRRKVYSSCSWTTQLIYCSGARLRLASYIARYWILLANNYNLHVSIDVLLYGVIRTIGSEKVIHIIGFGYTMDLYWYKFLMDLSVIKFFVSTSVLVVSNIWLEWIWIVYFARYIFTVVFRIAEDFWQFEEDMSCYEYNGNR